MIKVSDKVMIPQDEYPEINFVGLLIGPRGNTLKCKTRPVSWFENALRQSLYMEPLYRVSIISALIGPKSEITFSNLF